MRRPTIEAHFYETYHFSSAIRNVLYDQFTYIRSLNDFYGDGQHIRFSEPFPRFSAFHSFLEFVIDDLLTDITQDVDLDRRRELARTFGAIPPAIADLQPFTLPVEEALNHHGLKFETFVAWLKNQGKSFDMAEPDDIYEYLSDLRLCGPYDALLCQSVREVFLVLFSNRALLLVFNEMLARQIADTITSEIPHEYAKHFEQPGVLKRVRIPAWTKRAVFYRDRGRCVSCGSDLSGLLSAWSEEQFDHMIPLASGGINDVTNIQLLCATCNKRKGRGAAYTSNSYEDWYPMND